MKNKELREKIIAFNKSVKEKAEKASDMEVLMAKILELPKGQLKKILTDEIIEIFEKYGVTL